MNLKGLIQRAFTAIVFVAVMLLGLYSGRYSFIALFAVINVLCLWEFLGMVLPKQDSRVFPIRRTIGITMGILPFVCVALIQLGIINSSEDFILISAIFSSPFIFTLFIFELYAKAEHPFQNIAYIFLGIIYIGIPFALMGVIAFNGEIFYANTVFGLLLLSWLNDTGAYLIGSKIGKNKLFPRISPNKTWEGTMGGIMVTLLTALLLSFVFTELRTRDWMALGFIVAVFGGIGDLVESMLKRSVKVKDSGNLLPGHGGMLDRFDAFIFLIPFAAAYLLWIR